MMDSVQREDEEGRLASALTRWNRTLKPTFEHLLDSDSAGFNIYRRLIFPESRRKNRHANQMSPVGPISSLPRYVWTFAQRI